MRARKGPSRLRTSRPEFRRNVESGTRLRKRYYFRPVSGVVLRVANSKHRQDLDWVPELTEADSLITAVQLWQP
jgi:hypothetical protein